MGHAVPIERAPETSRVEVPLYISDAAQAEAEFASTPRHSVRTIVEDTASMDPQ